MTSSVNNDSSNISLDRVDQSVLEGRVQTGSQGGGPTTPPSPDKLDQKTQYKIRVAAEAVKSAARIKLEGPQEMARNLNKFAGVIRNHPMVSGCVLGLYIGIACGLGGGPLAVVTGAAAGALIGIVVCFVLGGWIGEILIYLSDVCARKLLENAEMPSGDIENFISTQLNRPTPPPKC